MVTSAQMAKCNFKNLNPAVFSQMKYLEHPLNEYITGGEIDELIETIASDSNIENDVDRAFLKQYIKEAIATLNPLEQKVIIEWMNDVTWRKIRNHSGGSAWYAIKNAKMKLAIYLESKDIDLEW
jgi:hypothetical protein